MQSWQTHHLSYISRERRNVVMKSIKKALLLVFSLVMLISVMTVTASAADGSPSKNQSLANAKVTVGSVKWTGKAQTGKVTVTLDGKTLVEGTDFTVAGNVQKNSGKYTVTVKGIGHYEGTVTGTFEIKANATGKNAKKTTIKTGATKKTVKASKKKKTVKISFKTGKNKAQITYKVTGGKKATRKAITVKLVKGQLRVTLPKNAKKGTYKIKVTVPAYNNYKKATKTFTIKVG